MSGHGSLNPSHHLPGPFSPDRQPVDNVGGEILDFALTRLNPHARIVLCGAISEYNATKPKGLQAYLNLISQRGVLQGFIVFDYKDRYTEAEREMAQWIAQGKLKRKETVV